MTDDVRPRVSLELLLIERETADRLRAENDLLRATLNRYRYVYAWWTADSCDFGGEMRARMHWARGEDSHHLSNDEIARIGQDFLKTTGRAR